MESTIKWAVGLGIPTLLTLAGSIWTVAWLLGRLVESVKHLTTGLQEVKTGFIDVTKTYEMRFNTVENKQAELATMVAVLDERSGGHLKLSKQNGGG